jgi:hypothetical protein
MQKQGGRADPHSHAFGVSLRLHPKSNPKVFPKHSPFHIRFPDPEKGFRALIPALSRPRPNAHIPEGHLKIARRFSAGNGGKA